MSGSGSTTIRSFENLLETYDDSSRHPSLAPKVHAVATRAAGQDLAPVYRCPVSMMVIVADSVLAVMTYLPFGADRCLDRQGA